MFEFLFKYRLVLFREGDFTFLSPWPMGVLLALAAIASVLAVITYGGTGKRATTRDRVILGGLRIGILALVLFSLLQPTLVLDSVVDQRNFVGILLDDSRSMSLPDEDGAPRADFVRETFGAETSPLIEELADKFSLRFYRFSSDAGRTPDASAMSFQGTRTDLTGALELARTDLSSVPLSGLVVVSDGAANAGTSIAEALVPLQAASIPVYTVGIGPESLDPDIQLNAIELPRTILSGTDIVVDVPITQRGYAGRSSTLIVEDGPRRLAEIPLEFERDGEALLARARFSLEEAGARSVRFRVPAEEGESVTQNNSRELLVEVREDRQKILYFEGEPRWEVKFLRRAVTEDENLQVVLLQRTADGKFMRLDVDDGEELSTGFPRTREELFRYRALVLGTVEARFFTRDQLSMIADFVSIRGGGLLVLGGQKSFAEGGYEGTALEEVLPVFLEEPAPDARRAFTEIKVTPTPAGLAHPVAALEALPNTEEMIALGAEPGTPDAWESLPPLSTLNRILRVKPGATTLLTGVTPTGEERVVLASQRYGRGTSIAFPVQDSWVWQMHADVQVEDQRHEQFWQQLLRWLVEDAPQPVTAAPERERIEPGETAVLTATVLDSAYLEVNAANVVASVTDPLGNVRDISLGWTIEENGNYSGSLELTDPGVHTIEVMATRGQDTLGMGSTFVQVGPSDTEYFDAARRTGTLRRLADDTGGRFYTRANLDELPEDLQYTGGGVTLREERDLWDMPIILLALLLLIGTEWGWRRSRGMI